MYRKTLLIDLDGVLNNYEKYTDEIPEIKQGAKEFLEKLYNSNDYELILFTTRNKLQSVKWLIKNDLDKYFKETLKFLHIYILMIGQYVLIMILKKLLMK